MRISSPPVLTLSVFILLLLASCARGPEETVLQGTAQGTTFTIRYHGERAGDYSDEVGQILRDMDQSLSLWVEDSFLSEVNAMSGDKIGLPSGEVYFSEVLGLSKEVYASTDGAFDPSIYPLVKAWGFGAKAYDQVEEPNVDSLMSLTGFDTYDAYLAKVGPEVIFNKKEGLQLDFNGIAQGYTVDVLGRMLRDNGVTDFMIEVGGEILTSGHKIDGSDWRIAIDKPTDGERALQATIQISDRALATSGSYRKYWIKDGKRYSHTIDPKTGRPVDHQMLSVTVVMDDAARADGYATAFMVMGVEETKAFVEARAELGIEVYLIYEQEGELKVYQTGRFEEV